MATQTAPAEALQQIQHMMQRSSRFISLSGLSGVAAGFWALVGAYIAHNRIASYYNQYEQQGFTGAAFQKLERDLLVIAVAVFGAALLSAFYFTWRRTRISGEGIWDRTSRMLVINTAIPIVVGAIFILTMLQYDEWRFVAPLSLVFYGLGLVNGSKYTLSDIRYLGLLEIALGLINTQYIGYGLHFWALGFGVLHIVYGFIMWWKYERKEVN